MPYPVFYCQEMSGPLLSCPMPDENLDYRNILESTKKVLHPGMLMLFFDALIPALANSEIFRIVPAV